MEPKATHPSRPNAPEASPRRTAGPLYQQIARTLKDEIVSGIYPVGSQLPTEDGLCERFSVSRYTVREALRLLRNDGLVASRQGAGTVVVPPRSGSHDMQQVMSIDDLVAVVSDMRLAIESIRTVRMDEKLAARTGLPEASEWLQVCGFRQAREAEAPACRTEYYINPRFAAVARLLQRHTGPIFPLIEDMFGQNIVEMHQQISASLVTPTLATQLKVKEGSPALEVRRIYTSSEGEIVQATINTHPASRFKHSMSMRRTKALA